MGSPHPLPEVAPQQELLPLVTRNAACPYFSLTTSFMSGLLMRSPLPTDLNDLLWFDRLITSATLRVQELEQFLKRSCIGCVTEESALAACLTDARSRVAEALQREDFAQAMAALALLRQPVDAFFDKVTVNTDDARLRENRLRLLSRIRAVMNQVADFSQIEG